MSCRPCNDLGYLETVYATGNQFRSVIEQCPNQCDIGKYTKEIQRRRAIQEYQEHLEKAQEIVVRMRGTQSVVAAPATPARELPDNVVDFIEWRKRNSR